MDILWGDHPQKPEGADTYSNDAVKAAEGDLILVSPPGQYKGGRVKPKGQWVELRPDHQFISYLPKIWSNQTIKKTVGVISGFDLNLCMHLANVGIENRFQKLDVEANIAIVNGPNLNLLGTREPELYGTKTLEQIFNECKIIAPNCNFVFRQSNSEGEIVTLIQKLRQEADAIIINAGAYTHTSVAIHDALRTYDDQIIELHLSNPHQREKFRHTSYVGPAADSMVAGFGAKGYKMALTAACLRL